MPLNVSGQFRSVLWLLSFFGTTFGCADEILDYESTRKTYVAASKRMMEAYLNSKVQFKVTHLNQITGTMSVEQRIYYGLNDRFRVDTQLIRQGVDNRTNSRLVTPQVKLHTALKQDNTWTVRGGRGLGRLTYPPDREDFLLNEATAVTAPYCTQNQWPIMRMMPRPEEESQKPLGTFHTATELPSGETGSFVKYTLIENTTVGPDLFKTTHTYFFDKNLAYVLRYAHTIYETVREPGKSGMTPGLNDYEILDATLRYSGMHNKFPLLSEWERKSYSGNQGTAPVLESVERVDVKEYDFAGVAPEMFTPAAYGLPDTLFGPVKLQSRWGWLWIWGLLPVLLVALGIWFKQRNSASL